MSENPSNAQKDTTQPISAQSKAAELIQHGDTELIQHGDTEPIRYGDTEGTKIIQKPEEAKIDIVFVHGLIGKEAWTSNTGVFWPDSLLKSKFPEARILSFKYSGKISPLFEEGTQIPAISNRLLCDLVDLREGTHTRPIIFVAHCLGGVILEDAIVGASTSGDEEVKGLVPYIRGILLLGTPHFKEGSEQDAKKYFQYAGSPESLTFDKQLQPLKLIYQNFIRLRGTSQAKFKIESFCASKGNVVSEALARWSENSRPRMLIRSQLQLSQYETENDGDFKQVMRILTSCSKIDEESKARTVRSEDRYVGHVSYYPGWKNGGMPIGNGVISTNESFKKI